MAETVTIARPYAEAVFELAKQHNALAKWSDMLAFAAAVAATPEVDALVDNPRIGARQLADLLIDICGERLTGEARNLLQVLVQNRRVRVLPDIRELYERMREEHEGQVEAVVTTALPLSEEQTRALSARLQSKYGRKVLARVVTDRSLIGGVKVQVGDEVIDGSIRGRLDAMAQMLAH
jgi:F-type H+-transporting ATPase subunit delta